jgi:excisionase family DNA binding protein
MEALDSNRPPRAYGVREFCKAFGVSRSTVYNLIAAKKLRSVRVAGRRLIPADAAEALLNGEG